MIMPLPNRYKFNDSCLSKRCHFKCGHTGGRKSFPTWHPLLMDQWKDSHVCQQLDATVITERTTYDRAYWWYVCATKGQTVSYSTLSRLAKRAAATRHDSRRIIAAIHNRDSLISLTQVCERSMALSDKVCQTQPHSCITCTL